MKFVSIRVICGMLLFALFSSVEAQQIDLITNIDGRRTTSLNGEWKAIIDPYESAFTTTATNQAPTVTSKPQNPWNRKGLISNRGEKKAFYVMQKWYRELAERTQD